MYQWKERLGIELIENKSIVMMREKLQHSGYILGNQNFINVYVY